MTEREGFWRGRSVMVTGATGMVGAWLTARLVDEGATVTALVLDVTAQSELYRSGTAERVHVVNGRLESFADVERAILVNDASVVVHLGAQTIVGIAHGAPRATFEANIQGTWNVLDACRLHRDRVQAVVVASSDKAYGEQDLPYTEASRLEGRHPYEVSKSCTDLLSLSYRHTYDLPVAVARCGNIFGGGDLNWSRIVPGTIKALLTGEQPIIRSNGKFLRDYLHVDNIVDAYLLLAEHTVGGGTPAPAYNFSDEAPLSVLDIYDAVAEAVGRPDVRPQVLDRAVGEIVDQYLDASLARADLGWKVTVPLRDGLATTVDWYRALLSVPA